MSVVCCNIDVESTYPCANQIDCWLQDPIGTVVDGDENRVRRSVAAAGANDAC